MSLSNHWEHVPLATALEYIQQCAKHLIHIDFPRACAFSAAERQGGDSLKDLSTDITNVGFSHPK
ncbi:hypothetical protein Xentx_00376 [Xenorhabdus thuongxuanensis]|uniref:Uncharacterized protein n=1 Tax=Xenorhabdus thuongxuanensis TaxID=1873484 RepID=A0A1Q5U8B2_9GAMM|nr:hypothetical protein Xentx_00376 [Xenorhabdus thuongxuanensis]